MPKSKGWLFPWRKVIQSHTVVTEKRGVILIGITRRAELTSTLGISNIDEKGEKELPDAQTGDLLIE